MLKSLRQPHSLFLACLGLSALGLFAPSAYAQDAVLNTGSVTVSSSGTIFDSSYSGTGFSAALGDSADPYNSIAVNGGAFLLGDGGTINGAFTDGRGNSYALETTGGGTAVVTGGTVNNDLYAYDTSILTLSGGTINGNLNAYDNSLATLSGGIVNGTLSAYNNSVANISNGTFNGSGSADALYTYDTSQANISGGAFNGVDANGSSQVNISGGTFATDGINALDSSTVNVTGGILAGLDAVSGIINFAGGNASGPLITQGGVLDLFGQFNGYSPGDTITSGSGSLIGTLLYGGSQTFQYDATQAGVIEFNVGTPPSAVPEASTAMGLALGIFCLVIFAIRMKRRTSGRLAADLRGTEL